MAANGAILSERKKENWPTVWCSFGKKNVKLGTLAVYIKAQLIYDRFIFTRYHWHILKKEFVLRCFYFI